MKLSHLQNLPRLLMAALFAALIATLSILPVTSARAAVTIDELVVDATLNAEGQLRVSETYTYAASLGPSFVKRFTTRQNGPDDLQYVQQLSNVKATVGGQEVSVGIESGADATTVTVESGDRPGPLVLSYDLLGTTRVEGDNHVFNFRALQGLDYPVAQTRVDVRTPVLGQAIECHAGPPNSTAACRLAAQGREDFPFPTFEDGARGAGEQVTAILVFDKTQVAATAIEERRWSLNRAFSASPESLLAALGALLVGGIALYALHRRAGADARPSKTPVKVAEFVPAGEGVSEFNNLGEVRPGHVGTIADERVDPIDLTATILDLAVRGHLTITELPRSRPYAPADWTLTRQDNGRDELAAFETDLLNIVAPVGETRPVSQTSAEVAEHVGEIQADLYDEMVEHGWYQNRPDQTRNKWVTLAAVLLGVAVVTLIALVIFTPFGLLGLALVALGIGGLFVAHETPTRTATGSALRDGLGRLSADLQYHPTDRMPKGKALRELSEVLPYAVVLGGVDRWLTALADAEDGPDQDADDLGWYVGPEGWELKDLPDSLRNFIVTLSGEMFTR